MRPPIPDPAGAVLVTGASSGIGEATVLALAAAGHHALAGVRRDEDGERLRAQAAGRLTPVRIDVTDPAGVEAALARAGELTGGEGLAGLVNNAGIGVASPVELLGADRLRRQLEVNVLGPHQVTRAALPLLRAGRGRIITIGSIGGELAMPFAGALCASKAAVASLTHALRMELAPEGLPVVLIEPAAISTPAVDALEREIAPTIAGFDDAARTRYAKPFATAMARAVAHERAGSPPSVVADAVVHALRAPRPKARYRVGKGARPMAVGARMLPDAVLDRLRLRALTRR